MDINKYNKYKTDKVSFIESFFKIRNPNNNRLTKTKLYYYQKTILKSTESLLIRKARGVGISYSLAMDINWNLNYQQNCNMLMVCPSSQMSDHNKYIVRDLHSMIPDSIQIPLAGKFSRNIYQSNINSAIEFKIAQTSFSHGQRYDIIYIEEADIMKNFSRIYSELYQMLSTNGKIIITSMPILVNSTFDYMWKNNNKFDKLDVQPSNVSYQTASANSLNKLSKSAYNKIINECVIV